MQGPPRPAGEPEGCPLSFSLVFPLSLKGEGAKGVRVSDNPTLAYSQPFSRYQRAVSSTPAVAPISGRQPSSAVIRSLSQTQ